MNKEGISVNILKYSYYYIDVEKLIVDNLDKRIKKLALNNGQDNRPVQIDHSALVNNHKSSSNSLIDSPDMFVQKKSKRRKSSSAEELTTQLLLYANIVTNSWVLSLIKKDIEENNFGPYEKIFIVNLIPNRITIFRNCLYLKQSPSFVNFNFNYIAINLVRHAAKRKDLEIKHDEQLDEITNNFINYFRYDLLFSLTQRLSLYSFRLINKVIDVCVEVERAKIRLKLSTSKNAFRIATLDDVTSFIYMPKKDGIEVNISDFNFDQYERVLDICKRIKLIFVVKNEIELDESTLLLVDGDDTDLVHVRKFIQLYRIVHYSLNVF